MKRAILVAVLAVVALVDAYIVACLVGALLLEVHRAAHGDGSGLAFIVAMLAVAVGCFVAAIWLVMRGRGKQPRED